MRLYSGWGTRRLTCTTIVFCILVETTGPTFSFLCDAWLSAIIFSPQPAVSRGYTSATSPCPCAFHAASSTRRTGPSTSETGSGTAAHRYRGAFAPFRRLRALSIYPFSFGRLTHHEFRFHTDLVGREPHRFLRDFRRNAFHLEQDLSRPDYRNPLFRSAFTLTHTGFSRLLCDRLIGEQPDPHFTAALDETGHRDTGGFNLPRSNPAATHCLQAVLAERNRRTAPGFALHTSALLLAEFELLGHQHS